MFVCLFVRLFVCLFKGLRPTTRKFIIHKDQSNRNPTFNSEFLVMFASLWLSSHSRNFRSYGDVTITGERLQILTYALHLWPLSIEGTFFSVPHLQRHGSSVYNGRLRGPMTLTSIAECLAAELSLPVFTT